MASDTGIFREPVIDTDPVNWCVLVNRLPNLVDPVTKSVDEVITCATIVWAVSVPVIKALEAVISCLTKKLSAEDAVNAKDEVRILSKQ